MTATKQRIIDAALILFNTKGINNVTLRDIAGAINISTGNLAYHFRNKDFITEAIFEQMDSERKELLTGVRQIPSFDNIHIQLGHLLVLGVKYEFFFANALDVIRVYPGIAEKYRAHIDSDIAYIRAMVDYSIGKGNMKAEAGAGVYDQLAHTVWMVLNFWLLQKKIRGMDDQSLEEARKAMWDLVLPHLTEKGRRNLQKSIRLGLAS